MKLLIVEDDEDASSFIKYVLETENHEVRTVRAAEDARLFGHLRAKRGEAVGRRLRVARGARQLAEREDLHSGRSELRLAEHFLREPHGRKAPLAELLNEEVRSDSSLREVHSFERTCRSLLKESNFGRGRDLRNHTAQAG